MPRLSRYWHRWGIILKFTTGIIKTIHKMADILEERWRPEDVIVCTNRAEHEHTI